MATEQNSAERDVDDQRMPAPGHRPPRAGPAPSARAMADEMPPPMAPAEIICISMTAGKHQRHAGQRVGAEPRYEPGLDQAGRGLRQHDQHVGPGHAAAGSARSLRARTRSVRETRRTRVQPRSRCRSTRRLASPRCSLRVSRSRRPRAPRPVAASEARSASACCRYAGPSVGMHAAAPVMSRRSRDRP